MKKSTLLINLLERTDRGLRYQILDTPGVHFYLFREGTTFDFDRLVPGLAYVVRCYNTDGINWVWEKAFPLDLTKVVS